jgi:hypothetical protein
MAVIENMATEKLAQGRCRKRSPQNTNQPGGKKKICEEIQRSEKEGNAFLTRIVTGGET